VAFKRFVDYVPMIIDFEMLKRFNRTIEEILFKELALGADNARMQCKAFLDEAPEVINRRNDLSGKLMRLDAARLELQKVCKSRLPPRRSSSDRILGTCILRHRS
jgi:hypothetical protein